MSYLLSVAIGPVQDFIAAARRSRDLWFGSYLLSELSKAVARTLYQQGARLIFPPPPEGQELEGGSPYNVSNKILAVVGSPPTKDQLDSLRKAAKVELRDYFDSAKRKIGTRIQLQEQICDEQLAAIVEFYAVWVPYEEARHNDCRIESELLLAARKATRDFPWHQGHPGRAKCSLDGFRENVLEHTKPPAKLCELRANEQLDAVAVVKRFAPPKRGTAPEFDSTIDVAGLPYLQPMKERAEYLAYKEFLQVNGYPKTIGHLYRHESRQLLDEDDDPQLLAELKEIVDKVWVSCGEPATPYYAILVGDGDSMGQAIEKIGSIPAHQEFSRTLSRFAAEAKTAVELLQGCPIYTGGDDVLALLPLHQLLPAIQELRRLFGERMKGYDGVTFSCGVAVAHALDPLSETLEAARSAEKAAKAVKGKNAVAITIIPRSGAPVSINGKADELLALLAGIEDGIDQEVLRFSLAYDLLSFLDRYPATVDSALPELLARHLAKKEEGEAVAKTLHNLAHGTPDREWLTKFCTALLVLRPLHRARREANRKCQ